MSKIALFYWDLQKGGAELAALNLVNQLVKNDINVELITMTCVNEYSFHDGTKYVKSIEKKRYLGKNILVKYWIYLLNFIKLFLLLSKYDVWVAGLEYRPSIILYVFSFLLHKKFNIWIHCNLDEYSCTVNKSENYLFKHALMKSNHIICCSNTSKNSLISYCSLVEQKIVVIRNFIDFANYKNSHADLKIPNTNFTIISVGRLVPIKGFKFLLESFAYLNEKHHVNCRLVICGDGELMNELKELVNTLSLSSQVSLVGNVDDISNYYNTADLFISSSKTESYSITTVEALYFGIPVIVTKTGAAEILYEFGVGSVLDYGDIIQLGEEMYKYISNAVYYQSQKNMIEDLDLSHLNDGIISSWISRLNGIC